MAQIGAPPCQTSQIDAEPCPEAAGRPTTPRQRRGVLTACVLMSSMAFIDGSALTVALPALSTGLDAGFAAIQWVINGYVLALAALTLIGGAMADVYGRARMVILGGAVFAAASVACALAPDAAWLIAARVVQGVGAAILTPASLALIGAVYPKHLRAGAIGVWAAASALTTAGGPVLGGWLTERFGWPAIFWMNPPLAVIAIALLVRFAPADTRSPRPFDGLGAAILAVTLSALAYGFSALGGGEGAGHGLTGEAGVSSVGVAPVWRASLAFAAAGLGAGAFVIWQRRTTHPMIPAGLFADHRFSALNAATLALYAALSVMFFLLPFALVDGRGFTPMAAGMAFLPFTLGVGLLSQGFGRLAGGPLGPKLLVIGPVIAAGAFTLMALGAQDWPALWAVYAPMGVLGLAFAMVVAPLTAAVMAAVDEADEGLASGVNNTAARIAQMLGVALAALIAMRADPATGYAIAALCALAAAFMMMLAGSDPGSERKSQSAPLSP